MELQEIELTISKNGTVEIHVRGVKGDACLDLTRSLEESLGGKLVTRELTPEAYDSSNIADKTHQHQNNQARK